MEFVPPGLGTWRHGKLPYRSILYRQASFVSRRSLGGTRNTVNSQKSGRDHGDDGSSEAKRESETRVFTCDLRVVVVSSCRSLPSGARDLSSSLSP